MIKALFQLLTSSVIVILIGILNSKLVANYFPFEYIGYFGFIKSNAVFFSSIVLFGLNYSFFFIEKDEFLVVGNKDSSIQSTFINSNLLVGLIYFFVVIFFITYYILKPSTGILLSLVAVFCSGVISVTSLYCKKDSCKSIFSKFWIYNLVIGLIYLFTILFAILTEKIEAALIFLIALSFSLTVSHAIYYLRYFDLAKFKSFFYKNYCYSKLFQINLLLSTGFLALIQHALLSNEEVLANFNAIVTIVSLLNIVSVVIGNYLFPRLVSNSKSEEHLMLYKLVFLSLFLFSFVVLLFFDFFTKLIFFEGFVSLGISVIFLLQAKIFEIISGVIGYKYSSDMRFGVIFSGLGLVSLPVLIYFLYAVVNSVVLSLAVISFLLMLGWYLRFVMYLCFLNEALRYKIIIPLSATAICFVQYWIFYHV
ncbi:TPA: hypothetical protein P0E14_003176 [Vibrio harveyi]|nr:hypothetical protein [Vibrio harveyi]